MIQINNNQIQSSQINLDQNYGPYSSIHEAHLALEDNELNKIGVTVGIENKIAQTIEEYWYQGGTNEQNLVKKQSEVDTSNLATKTELQQGLSGKQDTIDDLSTIRSGAAAGATAYQKPSDGIPSTALTSTVQTSLGKADSSIQGITRGGDTLAPDANKIVDIPEEIETVVANDVAAGGNPTATLVNGTLTLGIPRGADAVNPFKGWYNAITTGTPGTDFVVTDEDGNLVEAYPTPVIGDYAYIKTWNIDTSTTPQTETPIVKIYVCATAETWSDSGRTFNPENNQEFASGENLNEVFIESVPSSNSNNLVKSGGVKAELEKKARYSYSADGEGFMISDPSGYVVLQVDSEGNIITKNFNSSSVSSQHSQAPDSYKELVIGTFQRGTINQDNTITTSTTSIVTDTLAIPYEGAKLIVSLNEGYVLKVKCGFVDGDHGTRYPLTISGTFTDGDVIELPLTGTYSGSVFDVASMRFEVSKSDNSEITVAEGGNLKLFYKDQCSLCDADESLIQDIQIKAAKLGTGTNPVLNYNDKVVLVHGSDIHSDYTRLSLLYEVANSINADAVLLTGDIVMHNYRDGVTPMVELANKSSVPTLICVGNHEVGFHYGNDNFEVTDSGVFDYLFADMPNLQNYLSGVGTTTQVPYYYYDIADKKLRIISIYQYVSGAQTAQSGYNNLRWAIHFDATELSWFVNVLSNTPNDYGIVLLMHTPELSQNTGKIVDNDLFFSSYYDFGNTQTSISGGYVLRDIVDAFISRSSLSKAYTQGGTPSSITVSADFSSVDSSVEFIGVINGHYHQDAIGLISGAQERQVQLNIACTSSVRQQARKFDCIRNPKNNTGSAFNVYVLDRANNSIEIYRIGTHKTIDGRNRTQMTIAYK